MLPSSRAALLAAALLLPACAEFAPEMLAYGPDARADRGLQARRFDGIGEKELLDSAVGVLQDLGFAIETAGSALGFVQGTKVSEAKAPGQKLVVLILAVLAASQGGSGATPALREDQTISVLLSIRPAQGDGARSHLVFVTFHSHLRQPLQNSAGPLRDPVLYQSFFELLSRAIFLEGHKL